MKASQTVRKRTRYGEHSAEPAEEGAPEPWKRSHFIFKKNKNQNKKHPKQKTTNNPNPHNVRLRSDNIKKMLEIKRRE